MHSIFQILMCLIEITCSCSELLSLWRGRLRTYSSLTNCFSSSISFTFHWIFCLVVNRVNAASEYFLYVVYNSVIAARGSVVLDGTYAVPQSVEKHFFLWSSFTRFSCQKCSKNIFKPTICRTSQQILLELDLGWFLLENNVILVSPFPNTLSFWEN